MIAQVAVLFGSYARGDARPDSDLDTLRIEPIAVGERQWREDDASVIIEMARREGQEILLPVAA